MARIVMSKVAWLVEAPFEPLRPPRSREHRLVAAMQHYDLLVRNEEELLKWEKAAIRSSKIVKVLDWVGALALRLKMYKMSEWCWRKALKQKGWNKSACTILG